MKVDYNLNFSECNKTGTKYHRISVVIFIINQLIFFAFGLILASNALTLGFKFVVGTPLFVVGLAGAYFSNQFKELGRAYNDIAFIKVAQGDN